VLYNAAAWKIIPLDVVESVFQMPDYLSEKKAEIYTYYIATAYVTLNFEKAIDKLNEAITFRPTFRVAWNNIGLCLYSLEKYNEAIECYDKALEIDPKYTAAWNNKGNALHKLEKYNEAIECYDKALEIDQQLVATKQMMEKVHLGHLKPELSMSPHKSSQEPYPRAASNRNSECVE
jgi:tetratricopeptide (TPR) repeat protein